MTTIEDPKVVLRDLLVADWDDTKTLGITPDFQTGWRDEDLPKTQVTTGPDDESPLSDTGFTGMDGSGGGPTADTRGECQINVWTNSRVTDENPKQVVAEAADHIQTIVNDNWDISTRSDLSGVSNYEYISYLGKQYMPDVQTEPKSVVEHRYLITVRYEYTDRR